MKKMCFCPVALAAALLVALFFASCSNVPGNPPIVAPLPGDGTPNPQPPAAPGSEILQSAHAKVYKVPGGLMFKITRPTEDVFNPQKVVKEEAFNDYSWVGYGKGSYTCSMKYVGEGQGDLKSVYSYVGEGKGSYKFMGKSHYKEVRQNGNYRRVGKYVGEGNGYFTYVFKNVGQGNGPYSLIGKNHYKFVGYPNGNYNRIERLVGDGNGDYKYLYKYVGPGKGNYKLEDGEYKVDIVNGSYIYTREYVGQGNGNYKYEYESSEQGEYVYTEELVDEFVMVSPRDGSYMSSFEYVGQGSGNYKYEYESSEQGTYVYTDELVDEYVSVGPGNGDYDNVLQNVGQGNGDYKEVYEYVGPGNGYYEYKDTIKTYGNWTNVFITTSGGLSNGVVSATLDLGSPDKDVLSVFWPLCKPGKLCEYTIQIEPYDGTLRESILYEKLVVAADEGIGEIEKTPKHDEIILSYDGQKPTVKLVGLEPPVGKIQNLRTRCSFFATNQSELKADGSVDWDTNNAIHWIAGYDIPGAVDEFVWDDTKYWDSRAFNQIFDEKGKDTLYTSWHIVFDLPVETDGVSSWDFELWGKKNLLKIR